MKMLLVVLMLGVAGAALVCQGATETLLVHLLNSEDSRPIPDAIAQLQDAQGGISSSTRTDADGSATLALPTSAGDLLLQVSDDDQAGSVGDYFDRRVPLVAGEEEVTVRLLPNRGVADPALRQDYSSFLELVRRNLGKEPEALVDCAAVLGSVDTLSRGWGTEVTIYVGSEPQGTSGIVSNVIDELNEGLGYEYLRPTSNRSTAEWVMDYTDVNSAKDRELTTHVSFDGQGQPNRATFKVSGRFVYPNDLTARLRMAIAEVLFLNQAFDPRLIETGLYDAQYFEITTFSPDFLSILRTQIALGEGRNYALDLNEVNRSPVANPGVTVRAKVGKSVTLTSSASSDPDGRIATVTWQQLFGTREGAEYTSANEVAVADPHAATWAFTPQWPGNYRFGLRVTDNEGRSSSGTIDVEVTWNENPFTIRGADAFAYWDPAGLDTFAPSVLAKMVQHGVQWLEFSPYGWMRTSSSNDIVRLGDWCYGCPGFTIDDAALTRLIGLAHSVGLKVFLRPTLEFYDWAGWRGMLAPTDVGAWFASYTQFIIHYAQIARDTNVEMLSVGNELLGVQGYTAEWEDVIRRVRSIVPKSTLLTYCDQSLVWSYSNVRFWSALDLISVDFYYPITGSGDVWDTGLPSSDTPPYKTYMASITKSFREALERAHNAYGLDVLIAEAGCAPVVGANVMPSVWQFDNTAILDVQQQQNYLEALLQVASSRPWIKGVLAYCVELKSDLNYQMEDWPFDLSIAGRPAYTMLSYWFSGD